jgi:hypothetical protein
MRVFESIARLWGDLARPADRLRDPIAALAGRLARLRGDLGRRHCRVLVALFVGLMALNPIFYSLSPALGFWWQVAVLAALLAALLFVYAPFLPSFIRYGLDYGGQFLIMLLLFLLVWGQVGVGLGIPALIWNEDPWVRLASSFGATLLLCLLGVNSYYLGVNPGARREGTEATRQTRDFMDAYGLNLPFGGQVEPVHANGRMLSLHLRLARLPFLLLLALPTLFPAPFYYITNAAPVYASYGPRWSGLGWRHDYFDIDTRGGFAAYLYAALVWGAGVLAALFLIKLLFKWASNRATRLEHEGRQEYTAREALENYMKAILAVYGVFALVFGFGVDIPPSLAILAFLGILATANVVYRRAFTWPIYWALGVGWVLCLLIFLATLLTDAERADLAALALLALSLVGWQFSVQRHARPGEPGAAAPGLRVVARGLLGLSVVLIGLLAMFTALGYWDPGPAPVVLAAAVVGLCWAVAWGVLEPRDERRDEPALATTTAVAAPAVPLTATTTTTTTAAAIPGPGGDEASHRRGRALAVLALFAWILLVNHDWFKERFDLKGAGPDPYRRPVALTGVLADAYAYDPAERADYLRYDARAQEAFRQPRLLNSGQVLGNWGRRVSRLRGEPIPAGVAAGWPLPEKPKLVLVCVSGGAIRSAYWTAIVLDRLNREFYRHFYGGDGTPPRHARDIRLDFHDHVRIIAGASGGMVGTAYYVRWLARRRDPHEGSDQAASWYGIIPRASLQPVARYLALETPVRMLLPRLPWSGSDRGSVLQEDWTHLATETFAALAHSRGDREGPEATGEVPSLIYSPMSVDDGRRLLISNLDLMQGQPPAGEEPTVPEAEANWELPLARNSDLDDDNDATRRRPVSLSAWELFKIVPQAQGMSLATAARMSATFPLVSPAVSLPTEPPLRVVDAGYYDNYGVHLACAWAIQNRQWIVRNTSGLVVVQIRDSLSSRDRRGLPESGGAFFENVFLGLQFVTSVTDALLRARYTTMSFRNDQELAMLGQVFDGLGVAPGFLATAIFENAARVESTDPVGPWPGLGRREPRGTSQKSVAMNWYITRSELAALHRAIPNPGPRAAADAAIYGPLLDRTRQFLVQAPLAEEHLQEARAIPNRADRQAAIAAVRKAHGEALGCVESIRQAIGPDPAAAEAALKALATTRDPGRLDDDQRRLLRVAHIAWLSDMASQDDAEGGTDASRDHYRLEFERAMNYERMVSLFRWWQRDHNRPPTAGERVRALWTRAKAAAARATPPRAPAAAPAR